MKEPWVVYVPYCCCCPPKGPETSRTVPVQSTSQPAWKADRHNDSNAARALRDPAWLQILLRDCNGEVKVVWAKADLEADCNVISATLLDKLRKEPSDASTAGPSLEGDRRDQSIFVVQGGLGLSLPTKPVTEDGARTFANKQLAFTETVDLKFEAGHRRFNGTFCVLDANKTESEARPKTDGNANASDDANDDADDDANDDASDVPDLILGRPWLLENHVLAFDISFLQTPVDVPHVLEPPLDDAVADKLRGLHNSNLAVHEPRRKPPNRDKHTARDIHKAGIEWPEWAEIDPWRVAYPLSLMTAGVYALIVLLS